VVKRNIRQLLNLPPEEWPPSWGQIFERAWQGHYLFLVRTKTRADLCPNFVEDETFRSLLRWLFSTDQEINTVVLSAENEPEVVDEVGNLINLFA